MSSNPGKKNNHWPSLATVLGGTVQIAINAPYDSVGVSVVTLAFSSQPLTSGNLTSDVTGSPVGVKRG